MGRWSVFLWTLLKPLGSWGVFAIAAIDAAAVGLPLDPVVGGYVYRHPNRLWLYVLMASAGSALGSLIIYAVGYEMGELVLEKRMGAAKFARMRERFERHEFLALMLPAMMPPPFPFKLFALSAAAFEMHFSHFLIAIFAGRVARFLILSVLVLKFGPRAVTLAADLLGTHLDRLLIGLALAAIIAAVFWWVMTNRRATARLTSKQNATNHTDSHGL
ncbi:MAG: VTT domain-containing protein [Acidobacteriia bacterium]|nr:VTT domain-containing protein [Terriglobia bacterium]